MYDSINPYHKAVDKRELGEGGGGGGGGGGAGAPPKININYFLKSAITCVMIAMSILISSKENSEVPTYLG